MEDITTFQVITLCIGSVGAVLGIINTWHGLDRSRVKLKVRPARAIPFGAVNPQLGLSIEVTNLSAFAVTVREVGVLYRETKDRGTIVQPVLLDGGGWPRRLEPRSSVSVYSVRPESQPGRRIKCAYATTDCGVTRTGDSPALRQMAR